MNDDQIEHLWREAPEEPSMTHEQLTAVLEPRAERNARVLITYVWTYLLVQVTTLLLAGANMAGYRSNPPMLGVQIGMALAALGFAIHGVWLYGGVRRLQQMDVPLAAALRRRVDFYSRNATTWMWCAALSLVVFAFAISSLIDNVDGTYRINKPLVFIGVQVAMVLFLVAGFRIAHEPVLSELRAVLGDLEDQVLDRTKSLDQDQARWRNWRIALVVVLALLLALGAWLAWRGVG
ncbi:MAG: hypothetical protein GY711_16885 [bacterium]|nr:hypothetical protein [bacterium]